MAGRFDAFYALEEDKKQRILDAALEEFGEKPYKNASTNAIANKAQIGKGMLFYYFGSKLELFHFLCEYVLEFFRREYLDKFNCESKDFLERQLQLAELKNHMLEDNSKQITFFENFYMPENEQYLEPYAEQVHAYRSEVFGKLYNDVDESLFKEGIDPKHAMKYMTWILQEYAAEVEERWTTGTNRVKDKEAMDAEWKEFYIFMEDMRKLFYK